MSLPAHYSSIVALLASVFILIAGNGLVTTLVPLRATSEGFSQIAVGAIGSAYFAGMLLGSIASPWTIRRAGHIRAFAAFAAIATIATLIFPIHVNVVTWALLRAVHGFCFAGLSTTIDSWLNGKVENAMRGRVLGVYQVVHFAGSAFGNQVLRLDEPASFTLFSIVAMFLTLAIVPLSMTTADPPPKPESRKLELKRLYRYSPVGVVAIVFIGIANGTMWSLMPVYIREIGLSPAAVASAMTMLIVGSALAQFPVGRLSDGLDRRYVLIGLAVLASVAELTIFVSGASIAWLVLLGASFVLGAAAPTQYPVTAAHTNDRIASEHSVSVSSGLLLLYCIGAIVGPQVASIVMDHLGPQGMFLMNATVHLTMASFVLWRILQKGAAPISSGPAPDKTAPR